MPPGGHGAATGFLVEFYDPPPSPGLPPPKLWDRHILLNVHAIQLPNLEYHRDYSVVVRLVNCGSLGPASKPYVLRVKSQGNTPHPSPYHLLYHNLPLLVSLLSLGPGRISIIPSLSLVPARGVAQNSGDRVPVDSPPPVYDINM